MPEQPAPNTALVELHVEDFASIKTYYEALGFEVVWEREPDGFKGYLVMRMGQNVLCFWAGNEKVYEQAYFKQFPKETVRGYGVEVVLMVDDIKRHYERVKGTANIVEELRERPWGLKDFRCVDPAGYYLRFTSMHDILDKKYAVK